MQRWRLALVGKGLIDFKFKNVSKVILRWHGLYFASPFLHVT
jgi:hypothetical protein